MSFEWDPELWLYGRQSMGGDGEGQACCVGREQERRDRGIEGEGVKSFQHQ